LSLIVMSTCELTCTSILTAKEAVAAAEQPVEQDPVVVVVVVLDFGGGRGRGVRGLGRSGFACGRGGIVAVLSEEKLIDNTVSG
jgi:hypothetical protein